MRFLFTSLLLLSGLMLQAQNRQQEGRPVRVQPKEHNARSAVHGNHSREPVRQVKKEQNFNEKCCVRKQEKELPKKD